MIFLKIQITPFLKKWFKVGLNIRAGSFAGIFSLQEKRGLFSKQDDYQKCLIFKVLGYTFIQWLLISLHLYSDHRCPHSDIFVHVPWNTPVLINYIFRIYLLCVLCTMCLGMFQYYEICFTGRGDEEEGQ